MDSPSSRCQEPPLCSHGDGQDITVEQLFYVEFEDWSDEVVEATYYIGKYQYNLKLKIEFIYQSFLVPY